MDRFARAVTILAALATAVAAVLYHLFSALNHAKVQLVEFITRRSLFMEGCSRGLCIGHCARCMGRRCMAAGERC